jgi:acyl-CoA synthetase (AMP-forming)/AMP-acid ligase II
MSVSPKTGTIEYAALNEIGEIIVTGEHVIKGYLHGIGDSETKIEIENEIWHRTGDAGYIDKSGRLWLVGRASSVVRDEYGAFYPFQIEAPARSHPAIKRAALAQYRGKRILLVEPSKKSRTSINPSQIQGAFGWAHIDRVITIKRIPLDVRHGSKIDYGALESVLNSH